MFAAWSVIRVLFNFSQTICSLRGSKSISCLSVRLLALTALMSNKWLLVAIGVTKTPTFLRASMSLALGAETLREANSSFGIEADALPSADCGLPRAANAGLTASVVLSSATFLSTGAPWSIHQDKMATCPSESWVLPLGGMWFSSSSGSKQRLMSSLSSDFSAIKTGPFSPPFFNSSISSIRKPPLDFFALWH